MACLKIGSKSEALRCQGQIWVCSSGLASDVTIQVAEFSFQLHKFPLISRSGLLEKRIGESTSEDGSNCVVKLDEIPGGSKAFELVARFCYGIKFELNSSNVVSLRCAAEFLDMSEEYGEGNMIAQTEAFFGKVFNSWPDSLRALEACEEVLEQAEEVQVVSRCINSLAMKACSDPTLFGWPVKTNNGNSNGNSNSNTGAKDKSFWNGCIISDDWWYEDVSSLSWPLYKRLIKGVELKGMELDRVSRSIMFYARKNIPMMNKQWSSSHDQDYINPTSSDLTPFEIDQKNLLEEIVNILPTQKGVTQTKFLLSLLKTAMNLSASPSCIENLEKRVGAQLDQASLVDLLIPNVGFLSETSYDVDCFQRIVDHFMQIQQGVKEITSPGVAVEDGIPLVSNTQSIDSMTLVSELVDLYLAEIASDVNVKPSKFQTLAAVIPDYARSRYDGFYHAVDIYLKAHPWLTESEREQICRLMNCQKLSLEASTHAAQNERLPLRVVVQVLFFEQLRLRTQISGWFFVSDNADISQNRNQDESAGQDGALVIVGDVRERVSDLEKECNNMRREIQRLTRTKKKWSIFSKMFSRVNKPPPSSNFIESKSANPKVVQPSLKDQVKRNEVAAAIAETTTNAI